MRQQRSKYTNLPIAKSKGKKFNFGSAGVQRKPVTLAKVELKEYEDELYIQHIKPSEGPKIDEIHSWGFTRFENMTKEEYEKKFGKIK